MLQNLRSKHVIHLLISGLLLLFFGAKEVEAQQYRLEAGDRVRALVIGVTDEPYVAMVDLSGDIRFPVLGTHRAAGKTLTQLTDDIALDLTGREVRVVQDGVERILVLDERDIFLDIDSYRAVTVTGVVAMPGRIDFEPGLTARAAIGSAGGSALGSLGNDALRLVQLRGNLGGLQQTRAWLMADLWRIDGLLGDRDVNEIPEAYAPTLERRLSSADLEVVKQRITAARDLRERNRIELDARIDLVTDRIAFLRTALSQFQQAFENAEERSANLSELSDRGLTTARALAAAESGTLNASSRVLTTEADLAQAQQEMQSLLRQKEDVDADFYNDLLQDKSELERALAENGARIDATRNEMGATSGLIDAEGQQAQTIVLYRWEDGVETTRTIAPDTRLRPGDVLEVILNEE